MPRKQVIAQVSDTNHVARGATIINVDFDHDGPINLVHGDCTYHYTGKGGVNIASGQPVREMATDRSARLWITLDASSIWED